MWWLNTKPSHEIFPYLVVNASFECVSFSIFWQLWLRETLSIQAGNNSNWLYMQVFGGTSIIANLFCCQKKMQKFIRLWTSDSLLCLFRFWFVKDNSFKPSPALIASSAVSSYHLVQRRPIYLVDLANSMATCYYAVLSRGSRVLFEYP